MTKTRMTMLTSVVQVPASTGVVRALASRSTGARRAKVHLPSATLEATTSLMTPAVTDRSANMVRRAREVTVDVLVAPAMAAKRNPVTVVSRRALMVDAPEAQVTAASKNRLDMAARRSPDTEATVASKRAQATVVKNRPDTETTHTALAVATVVANLLLVMRAVTVVDVVRVEKSHLATIACLVVSAVTMSLASEALVGSPMAAATMMTSMAVAGKRGATASRVAMAKVATAAEVMARVVTERGTRCESVTALHCIAFE